MDTRQYGVSEVARISRVTVRTLHYYDEIGLLRPSDRSAAGYRLYSDDDLLRLQQVLIGRALGLPLEEIRRMLDHPDFDHRQALLRQRKELAARARETSAMIVAVDAALRALESKGDTTMRPKELFEAFDPARYEAEAQERWGSTEAYRESARRTRKYSDEEWKAIRAEEAALLARFAKAMAAGVAPQADEALELAESHRLQIDRWYYPCSREMHAALGKMYLADPRFTAHFEKHATGLAAYVAAAIAANAARPTP